MMESYLVLPMGQLLAHFPQNAKGQKIGVPAQYGAVIIREVRNGCGKQGVVS